jgi:hypothetical protein
MPAPYKKSRVRQMSIAWIRSNLGERQRNKECFDKLSMNGNFSANSNLAPFVLSPSKDSERFSATATV